ncbi:MAG: vanadium-dependent haloperoxidase [Shimia sp.]
MVPALPRRAFLAGSAALLAAARPALALPGCGHAFTAARPYTDGVVDPANASTVIRWSDAILQAIRAHDVAPPAAARLMAMAHLAGYAAATSLTQTYPAPYDLGPAPDVFDADVAYGTAVATTLAGVLRIDASCLLDPFLAEYPDNGAKAGGHRWGTVTARAVLADRQGDGSAAAATLLYAKTTGPMAWTPTGPHFGAPSGAGAFRAPLMPGWGHVRPFAISGAEAYMPDDFPSVRGRAFEAQLQKVRAIGGMDSATRTEDETQIAWFWLDGAGSITPPGHWALIALRHLQDRGLGLVDLARAMALVSLAQADAGIATWHCKYHTDVARPETAIRRGGFGQPHLAAMRDPDWRTLIPTPDFPAYTSGHSAFSGAGARMIANLIGTDDVAWTAASPDPDLWPQLQGVTRSWTSLSQAAAENGASREYGGVHWEHDNLEGLRVGARIADAVFATALPLA